VDNPTLTRFFALHFLLPFLITASSIIHIFFLHSTGSNNPLGIPCQADSLPFHCYFTFKDVFGFVLFVWALLFIVFFFPYSLAEPENFIPANPLVTPPHIVPEWYFLFAYSVLRSVPSKLGGTLALLVSVLILILLSFSHSQLMKGFSFYGPVKSIFWLHVVRFFLLTLGGSWPVDTPYLEVTRVVSLLYFSFYFLIGVWRHLWDSLLS